MRPAIALALVVLLAAAGGLFGLGPSEARSINNNTRTSVNRTVNVNRNVNMHRDVDIDVDVDRGWDVGRAVATTAAVTATAAVTSAVVGSMVRTLPPACQTVMVDGFAYQNCGGLWYQPQYAGANVTYVVVVPPR